MRNGGGLPDSALASLLEHAPTHIELVGTQIDLLCSSGCLKSRVIDTAFGSSSTLAELIDVPLGHTRRHSHAKSLSGLNALIVQQMSQGKVGQATRLARLSLEPLTMSTEGTVMWNCRRIGSVTYQGKHPVGVGTLIACELGSMLQQEKLDVHKDHALGISSMHGLVSCVLKVELCITGASSTYAHTSRSQQTSANGRMRQSSVALGHGVEGQLA